jgi:hypothetical protein
MGSGPAPAPQKAADSNDVWKNTVWGSRDSFIKDQMELEGYSAEAAEEFAAIWERAERRLNENPPEVLRSE